MPHINSYFDLTLLDYIFNDFQNTSLFLQKLRDDEKYRENWTFLTDLIYKNSFLHLQSPESVINKAKSNPYYQRLINSSTSGGTQIKKIESIKINNKYISPSAVFYFYHNVESEPHFFVNFKDNFFNRIGFISDHKKVIVHKESKKNEFISWDAHIVISSQTDPI